MKSSPAAVVLAELENHGPTGWPGNDPRPCECDPDVMYDDEHIAVAVARALDAGGYTLLSDAALGRVITHGRTIQREFRNSTKVPAATLISNVGNVCHTLLREAEESSRVIRAAT